MPGKRLYRSLEEKKIGGVCGGVAEYFDIDPVIVRVAAVLLVFLHGIGAIAYIVALIVVPVNPGHTPRVSRSRPRGDPSPPAPDTDTGPEGSIRFAEGMEPGPSVSSATERSPSAGTAVPPEPGSDREKPSRAPSEGSVIGGGVLVAVGAWLLLMNLGIINWRIFAFWRWEAIWPLVVIGIGLYMVSTPFRRRKDR